MGEGIELVELSLLFRDQRVVDHARREHRLAEEVMVTYGHLSHFLIGLHVLNVGLDDRVVTADRGDFVVLAHNDAINRLVHCRDRAGCR